MSDTELPTNRAILAVYLFYEEHFLIALTPKWLLKNWCSSWSIHSGYLSFLLFILSITGKFVRGKIMHSRNWRLFVKVDRSIRNDQHCICDIVYIDAVKRDRCPPPPLLPPPCMLVSYQFLVSGNFLGRCFFSEYGGTFFLYNVRCVPFPLHTRVMRS